MLKTKKFIRIALVLLILMLSLLTVLSILTGATSVLLLSNPVLLGFSLVLFILSIFVWLFSWSLLIVVRNKKPIKSIFRAGFSAVFGSLTPVQLGSDLLRSMFLKDEFNIPMSESFSASMVVKGLKFSFLAFASTAVIITAFSTDSVSEALFLPLLSGFFVVILASLLFLLPLNKKIGYKISRLFGAISKKIKLVKPLEKYFIKYSDFLREFSVAILFTTFLLAALSWVLEFFSLYFVFASLGISIPIISLLVFFILIAVLERTPVIPRGILLVELVGFAFLSFPMVSQAELSIAQIGSVLVLFDVARIIFPVLSSLVFYVAFKAIQAKNK